MSDKYIPGTIPGGGDKTMNKTESYLSWREIGNEQGNEETTLDADRSFESEFGVVLFSAR